jgi:hypothetical protein
LSHFSAYSADAHLQSSPLQVSWHQSDSVGFRGSAAAVRAAVCRSNDAVFCRESFTRRRPLQRGFRHPCRPSAPFSWESRRHRHEYLTSPVAHTVPLRGFYLSKPRAHDSPKSSMRDCRLNQDNSSVHRLRQTSSLTRTSLIGSIQTLRFGVVTLRQNLIVLFLGNRNTRFASARHPPVKVMGRPRTLLATVLGHRGVFTQQ